PYFEQLPLLASQSVQSTQSLFTFWVPTLTSVAKGTIDTLMSPGTFSAACSVSSRLCAAVFSADILPFDAIDPVLSSASARFSFLMPQSTSLVAEIASSD